MSIQQEITQGLKSLLDLTMLYGVTNNGFVQNLNKGERVMVNVNQEKRHIFVYSESLPDGNDYVVFNPLNEHVTSFDTASNWFYSVMRSALFARTCEAINLALVFMQKSNGIEVKDAYQHVSIKPSPKCLTKIGAQSVGKNKHLTNLVDKETLDRIKDFLDTEYANLHTIYPVYNKRHRKGKLCIPLITESEEDWENGVDKKKMRKNDVTVLKHILTGIFGNVEDIEAKAPSIEGPGKLTTLLTLYYHAYEKLLPFLEIIDELLIDEELPTLSPDMTILSNFIGNIERFSKGVLWLVPGGKDPVRKESSTSIPTSRIPDPSDFPSAQPLYPQGQPMFGQPTLGNPYMSQQQPNRGYTGVSRFGTAPQWGQPMWGAYPQPQPQTGQYSW